MLRRHSIRAIATAFAVLGLAFAATFALAQEMLQLGSMTYARAEAPYLRMPVSTSHSFFRKVGGVAFSAVAEGNDGLLVTDLRYDSAVADGSRLVMTLRRRDQSFQIRAPLFDWELIPIARFARDENGSAMTLFGQLKDKNLEKQTLDREARIINYHSALDNTLLGQRLFQADILIIQPNASHVFRNGDALILGPGESGHDPERNLAAFKGVQRWQEEQASKGNLYQSYVVGDLGQKVAFNVQGGKLVFSGRPYWAAWKNHYSQEDMQARVEQIKTGLGKKYEDMIASYNSAIDDVTARKHSMTASEQRQVMESLEKKKGQIEALEKQLESEMDAVTAVDQMPEYSAQLSEKIASVGGVNPLVYAAVTKVMHYRSLFKHFQRRDAAAYSRFVQSIANVEPKPSTTTPTVQRGL
jgi:hypothetical protein